MVRCSKLRHLLVTLFLKLKVNNNPLYAVLLHVGICGFYVQWPQNIVPVLKPIKVILYWRPANVILVIRTK